MRRVYCLLALALAALAFAAPAVAHAATPKIVTQGAATAFALQPTVAGQSLAVRGDSDQSLIMPYQWSTIYQDAKTDPRSIQVLSDGSVLFADGFSGRVFRVSAHGAVLWQYQYAYQGSVQQAWSAWLRTDGPAKGDVIVTLRGSNAPPTQAGILEVIPAYSSDGLPANKPGITDPAAQGSLRWPQFLESGNAVDTPDGKAALRDPFSASPVPGTDHTLICDGKKGGGGYRVVEVDDTGTMLWHYGLLGTSGFGPGLLDDPRSAQRLPNGDTLICDSGVGTVFDRGRVIEVRPNGSIAWTFSAGLNQPNSAWQLPHGEVVIDDQVGNAVLTIDRAQRIKDSYGPGEDDRTSAGGMLQSPRAAYCTASGGGALNGWTVVADHLNSRVMKFGYANSATATSTVIDPNSTYAEKTWTSITLDVGNAAAGSVSVKYSTNGGASWVSAGAPQSNSSAVYLLGTATRAVVAPTIQYAVTLTASRRDAAPVLKDVKIGWLPPGESLGTSGTGTGTGTGTGGHGTGSGSGTGGTGKGKGTGSGTSSSSGDLTRSSGGSTKVAAPSNTTPDPNVAGTSVAPGAKTITGFKMQSTETNSAGGSSNTGPGSAVASGQDPALGAIPGIVLIILSYGAGVSWSRLARFRDVFEPLPMRLAH